MNGDWNSSSEELAQRALDGALEMMERNMRAELTPAAVVRFSATAA